MKRYHAWHSADDTPIVMVEYDSWPPGDHKLRHTCTRAGGRNPCHSPTGFEWGYLGSGPTELARMLLRDYLRRRVSRAVYQAFKVGIIAELDAEWWLDDNLIETWWQQFRRDHRDLGEGFLWEAPTRRELRQPTSSAA